MKKYARKREGSGEPLNSTKNLQFFGMPKNLIFRAWGNRRFPRFGRKGFVLTFDATIAASIAIIMVVAIVGIISAKSYDMRLPHSIAEDLLSAMDASGELQKYAGYSSQQIQQSMQSALQVLPKNLCGNMTVGIYDANDFNKVNTYNANTCQTIAESTNAKRIFADYTKEKFGIIELSVRL